MIASFYGELQAFSHRLAADLSDRLRPGMRETKPRRQKSQDAAIARALEHVSTEGAEFGRKHKVGLIKRLLITRAFQREMNEKGFEGAFIRDATLTLVRALTTGKS